MWMITGDRMETALNIGRSSNLLKPTTEVLTITVTAPELIHDLLSRLLDKINRIKMEQTFSIHVKTTSMRKTHLLGKIASKRVFQEKGLF